MFTRFRHQQLGGHVHVQLFIGPTANHTLQCSGELVFDIEQWKSFELILKRGQSATDLDIVQVETRQS